MLLTSSLQNRQQVPCKPAVPRPELADSRVLIWLDCSSWGPSGLEGRLKAAVAAVLVEKGAERWKVVQSCSSWSPRPPGSIAGIEVGARSGGFVCSVVVLGLSSAQPHPNTAAFIAQRSLGLQLLPLWGLKPFTTGEQGGFSPWPAAARVVWSFRIKQLSGWSEGSGASPV